METWDAIRARRNVRQYSGQPIAREDLERICEAGRRAPSAGNWQPWDFIVVTDREQLRELAKVWRGAGHVATSAATIAVIGPAADNQFGRAQLDLGQTTMAMLLAAGHTLAEAARQLGVPRTSLSPSRDRLRRAFEQAGLAGYFGELPSSGDATG